MRLMDRGRAARRMEESIGGEGEGRGRGEDLLSRLPRFEGVIDMRNPFLNRTVDGFLTIGTVAATRVAADEVHRCLREGNFAEDKLKETLKRMCKEGAYWGTVAEMYVGMEYGMKRIRGKNDWKNALLGGAITGALISVVSKNKGDKVIEDAIRGGAVATAAKFLNYAH